MIRLLYALALLGACGISLSAQSSATTQRSVPLRTVADSTALDAALMNFRATNDARGRVLYWVDLTPAGDIDAFMTVRSTFAPPITDSLHALVKRFVLSKDGKPVKGVGLEVISEGTLFISAHMLDRRDAVLLNRSDLADAMGKAARRADAGGEVLMMLLVNSDGRVTKTHIGKSSGSSTTDQLAADVAMTARFNPCTADGVPVQCWATIPVILHR